MQNIFLKESNETDSIMTVFSSFGQLIEKRLTNDSIFPCFGQSMDNRLFKALQNENFLIL